MTTAARRSDLIELWPVDPGRDALRLHEWLTQERAVYWGMQGWSVQKVQAEYERIAAQPAHHAQWGTLRSLSTSDIPGPHFLVEHYDPALDEVGKHYAVRSGDCGMHFIVAPPRGPSVPGFTRQILWGIVDWLLDQPGTERIVVEPDVRNTKVIELNASAGFIPEKTILLPEKQALLSFCVPEDFRDARN